MSGRAKQTLMVLGALMVLGGLAAGGALVADRHIEPHEAGFVAFLLVFGAGMLSPERVAGLVKTVVAPAIAAWRGTKPSGGADGQ